MPPKKEPAREYFSPKTGKMKKLGKTKPRFLHVVENLAKAKTKTISINCDLLTVTEPHFTFSAEYDFGDLTATVATKDLLEVAKLIQDKDFKIIAHNLTPNSPAEPNLEFVWAGNSTRINISPPTNEEHATGHPELDQSIKKTVPHGFAEMLFVAGAGVSKDGFFDKKVDLSKNYHLDKVILDGQKAYSSDGYLLSRVDFAHNFDRTLVIHGSAYRMFRSLDLPTFDDVEGCWEVYERGLSIKFEGGFELFCLEPSNKRFPDISKFHNPDLSSEGVRVPGDFWKVLKLVEKSNSIDIKHTTMEDDKGKVLQIPFSFEKEEAHYPFRCRPASLMRLAELVSEGARFWFNVDQGEKVAMSWLTVQDPCGDFFYLAGLLRKVEN